MSSREQKKSDSLKIENGGGKWYFLKKMNEDKSGFPSRECMKTKSGFPQDNE
jgi:hypothetical protein